MNKREWVSQPNTQGYLMFDNGIKIIHWGNQANPIFNLYKDGLIFMWKRISFARSEMQIQMHQTLQESYVHF